MTARPARSQAELVPLYCDDPDCIESNNGPVSRRHVTSCNAQYAHHLARQATDERRRAEARHLRVFGQPPAAGPSTHLYLPTLPPVDPALGLLDHVPERAQFAIQPLRAVGDGAPGVSSDAEDPCPGAAGSDAACRVEKCRLPNAAAAAGPVYHPDDLPATSKAESCLEVPRTLVHSGIALPLMRWRDFFDRSELSKLLLPRILLSVSGGASGGAAAPAAVPPRVRHRRHLSLRHRLTSRTTVIGDSTRTTECTLVQRSTRTTSTRGDWWRVCTAFANASNRRCFDRGLCVTATAA